MSESKKMMTKVSVAIIGGGASGLQCASSLLNACNDDLSVLVLEARDRLGGRVYSTRETRNTVDNINGGNSQQVSFFRDHGAAWVHGIGYEDDEEGRNPIVSLLQEITPEGEDAAQVHLVPVFNGNPWTRPDTSLNKAQSLAMFVDGKLIPTDSPICDEAIRQHYNRKKLLSNFVNNLYESGKGMEANKISVESAKSSFLHNHAPDSTESSEVGLHRALVEQITSFYEFLHVNWLGISTTELAVDSFLGDETIQHCNIQTDEVFWSDGDYRGPHCKVKNGMFEALRPLISKVDGRIHLGERVVRIQDRGEDLLIETEKGLQVVADCCVCSIPLGCLQVSEIFDPALSEERLEALKSISTGAYKKVFLTFDRIFWPTKQPFIALVRSNECPEDGVGKCLLVNNLWAKDGIPCIEAVLCGDPGKWACKKSDEDIQRAVNRFLEDAMGLSNVNDWCVGCHVTRWEEDPFTLGSYSGFRTGSSESHVELLRGTTWKGRLIFCGDYTELDHMGAFHAALMSGVRAAEDVKEYFSVCSQYAYS